MQVLGIRLLPVLASAVIMMALGFLWHSPALFARPWMIAMGLDPDDKAKLAEMQKGAGKLYGISFLASLVTAFVLSKVIIITTVHSPLYGMKVAFAMWLGFVTTVQLTGTLFSKQPLKLYLINTGYQLVSFLAMGGLLAVWH